MNGDGPIVLPDGPALRTFVETALAIERRILADKAKAADALTPTAP